MKAEVIAYNGKNVYTEKELKEMIIDYAKEQNADLLEALEQLKEGMKILKIKNPNHKGIIQDIKLAEQAINKAKGGKK